jgi:hypothetical protein
VWDLAAVMERMFGSCHSRATSSLAPFSWSPRCLSLPRRAALREHDPGCRGAADNGPWGRLAHNAWAGPDPRWGADGEQCGAPNGTERLPGSTCADRLALTCGSSRLGRSAQIGVR